MNGSSLLILYCFLSGSVGFFVWQSEDLQGFFIRAVIIAGMILFGAALFELHKMRANYEGMRMAVFGDGNRRGGLYRMAMLHNEILQTVVQDKEMQRRLKDYEEDYPFVKVP
ncbi:MAG: hypothetical protein L0Z53_26935 [Acidobacteriales bacterium]|nr:hypothetical protein [Terriglobales bacterium]